MSDVPLRDYLEKRICELDRRVFQALKDRDARVDLALTSAKEAVSKAETAYNERFKLLNEFRGQSSDEARKYALSQVIEQQFTTVAERIVRIEERLATAEHAVSILQGRALAFAGIGSLVAGIASAIVVKVLS